MSQEASDTEPAPGVLEAAFQALPALGSDEYLAHIENSTPSNLPPEVLVRALRQLPAGSVAWEATFARLVRHRVTFQDGETEIHWDYLGPLARHARRQARRGKRDSHGDLLQDALTRIWQVLPTPRGEFAERAWHSFCRRELSDAWRGRHGRRGERFPREESVGLGQVDDEPDPLAEIAVTPPWHAVTEPNHVQRIEAVAKRVLDEIPDRFVRSVAEATWFNAERPRVSGRWDKGASLTSRFPRKSRYQLMRALDHADAQLAAALRAEPDIEWTADLQSLLRRLAGDAATGGSRRKKKRTR